MRKVTGIKKRDIPVGTVVHNCNPNYSRDREQEGPSLRLNLAKFFQHPI
jgi:hypothetical protein